MTTYWHDEKRKLTIYHGDNREACRGIVGVSAVVTDPPYGISFMGKGWDKGVPGVEFWTIFMACCLPGAHMTAFGGTRKSHRLVSAIEDAGWEIRDSLAWIFGQGFPKSLDVSKAIDREAGVEREVVGHHKATEFGINKSRVEQGHRPTVSQMSGEITTATSDAAKQWCGWGTALKPAIEPICLARKPIQEKTVASNVLKYGTGALNIDSSRIGTEVRTYKGSGAQPSKLDNHGKGDTGIGLMDGRGSEKHFTATGRFPANVILDEEAAAVLDTQTGQLTSGKPAGTKKGGQGNAFGEYAGGIPVTGFGDAGGASRFFYTAKASQSDRGNHTKAAMPLFGVNEEEFRNTHPTVKPVNLMRYLLQLVTPAGGIVLDPFMGSGSTLVAAAELGIHCIGIEKDESSCAIAAKRLQNL